MVIYMECRITLQAEERDVNKRLDQFIASRCMDLSRSYIQKLIKEGGRVSRNGDFSVKSKELISLDDIVAIQLPEPQELKIEPQNIALDILYEDEDIIVINKPKGMVVHPAFGHYTDTLVNAVLYHCGGHLSGINGILRPGIVHRIDKDTTGSLVVCKNDRAHQCLSQQFRDHTITRTYHAIVYNNFSGESGTIDKAIGRHPTQRKKWKVLAQNGKRAVTHYKILDHLNKKYNYIECRLETGRTHQIRVHMAHIGHPLVGDSVYGPDDARFRHLEGQTLHAKTLGFVHPTTDEYMEFEAPVPEYFTKLLKTMK